MGWGMAVLALFVVSYALVSGRLERTVVTGPMVFVAFGLLMGEDGLDLLNIAPDDESVELLAEVTLGLLLFSDAIRIDLRLLRQEYAIPVRLLGIGLPLTIIAGVLVGLLVFPNRGWVELALIAAILAPTDAALGQAVVSNERVPVRIRQSLNVESGLNDGIALPVVTILIAALAEEDGFGTAAFWGQFVVEQIGYGLLVGIAVGFIGGRLIIRFDRLGWMEGTWRQLSVLGIAAFAFVAANEVGGNSFIATFVAGLTFGAVARESCPAVQDFAEDAGQLLAMLTFVVFGATLVGPALGEISVSVILYAVLSLTAIRMLPVALSLLGSGIRARTVAFVGWFGPRGLASILFGLAVLEEEAIAANDKIFSLVTWTVLLSVYAHGLTSAKGAERYGDWYERTVVDDRDMAEAMDMHEQRIRRPPRLKQTKGN